MVWQFLKRHRRKLFILSLLAGGGYAAVRYINGKMVKLFNEQETMLTEWKKQLYYEHNRDMSLRTSTDIFAQVVLNINRTFECDTIRDRLATISDSTQKRELWEQLRVECFARLFTFAYSSSFILALTELVVSALSGRLYSQSQLQHTSTLQSTAAAATTTTASSKSVHAESAQTQSALFSRDIQLACLDVIRYATDAGMNSLIEDIRNATQSILSRIPLQQMLDINDVIWYCSEIRHQIEKKRHHQINASQHPLLKYVRSPSLVPQPATTTTTTTATTSSFSLSNVVSTASALFTPTRTHPPPILFNIQQQFELECIEMIESEPFQRVLTQIVEQSFSNIYDEFAREMVTSSSDMQQQSSTLVNPQFPLAKLIPMSNNIYTKLSGHHEQLLIHFQSLSCRPELHDYTKYAYDLFSNESPQSPSRTAYSLLPTSSIPFDLSSFLHSWMAPH